MALNLPAKQKIITDVSKIAKNSMSLVIAEFRSVAVNKINELRKAGRESGVYIRVVRNTFMRRIVTDTTYDCLKKSFIGPTMVGFSNTHPGTAARLFKEFAKANPTFKIKAASFAGEFISSSQIDRLATLPIYEEAITRMILTIKEASIGKLVRILLIINDKKRIATENA